jgi:hypothetical protein
MFARLVFGETSGHRLRNMGDCRQSEAAHAFPANDTAIDSSFECEAVSVVVGSSSTPCHETRHKPAHLEAGEG